MTHRRAALPATFAPVAEFVAAGTALARGKSGYPDRVTWSGLSWQVKTSNAAVGPGQNAFSKANVSVDAAGLHLRIAKDANGRWMTSTNDLPVHVVVESFMFAPPP